MYNYFNEDNDYICTKNCSGIYNKLITEKNKCTKDCKNDDVYKYEYNKKCYEKCPNGTIYIKEEGICIQEKYDSTVINTIIYTEIPENEISKQDEEIINFKNNIINNEAIIENAKNGEDFVKEEKDILFQVTSSKSQKNNTNKNISSIDLKDCEDKLKSIYKINPNLPLIIIKIDYYSKDTKIPIVGYEIYHPENQTKLDLSYCKEILIKLNIPVNIDESNLFKHDPNSGYYTDNCYSYTTDEGTDILLSDRKKEFLKNNMSLCESNCEFAGYNSKDKQSSCDCRVKNKIDLVSEIVNDTQKLSKGFSSEEINSGTSNIITIKCTKVLFSKEGLVKNISSYIISISMIYFLLSVLLFIKCGYHLLLNDINEIIISKKTKTKSSILTASKRKKKSGIKKTKLVNKSQFPPKKKKINKGNNNIITNNKKDLLSKENKTHIKNRNLITNNRKITLKSKTNKSDIKLNNTIKNNHKNIKYNYFELNSFDYNNALINDERTCIEHYIALIRIKQPLLFAFCPIKDFNSMVIKQCIFLFSFDIYYVINFAFFNENIIHKLYQDEGDYDIIYFIPTIIISFVVSNTITIIIKFIFLSERNIIQVRNQKTYIEAINISEKVKRNILCKYIIFYILGIIFIFFFWMILSSFGAVYQNSQIILLENALISFGISFIYPLFYNIIPSLFRFCSLRSNEKNMIYMYKFSQFLIIL